MGKRIKVYEVGPRDGFQNQKRYISKNNKLKIIEHIVESGIKSVQITSFMSPKAIPQMIDAAEVASFCTERYPELEMSALVPNCRGAERAAATGLKRIFYVASLSESHNQRNINRTHEKSMEEFIRIRQAYPEMHITLDLATAFGCPFEGITESADQVVDFLGGYAAAGIDEVDLCDTIGIADPGQIRKYIRKVKESFPGLPVQVHIHDTRNMGMVNTLAAIEAGVDTVQSTLGGLGGCPFAPGASGNLATEDLVYMLNRMGYETGIDFGTLLNAAKSEKEILGEGNFSGHHISISEAQTCLC